MAGSNYFEKVTKFLPEALDTVIARESITNIFENGNKIPGVKFDTDTQTVKIPRLAVDGFGNYLSANNLSVTPSAGDYAHFRGTAGRDGYPIKGADGAWESFQLQWNRGVAIPFDKIDDMQEAGLFTAHLSNEFARTRMVPEIDALRISTIAGYTNATVGNRVYSDPTALNDGTGIIHTFNAGYEYMSKLSVDAKDQVILCTPHVMTLIRNSAELYKRLDQAEYHNGDISFTIKTYEGRPIIEVPSAYMLTNLVAGDNGVQVSTTSKLVNFIIVKRSAVMPFTFLKKAKVYGDDTIGAQFDGYVFVCHLFHGLFVPMNKRIEIYANMSNTAVATAYSNVLLVACDEGANTGAFKLSGYYTIPAGLRGQVVASSTAYTVGQAVVVGTGNTLVYGTGKPLNTDVAGLTGGLFFTLVSYDGIAVAISDGAVTPPYKA